MADKGPTINRGAPPPFASEGHRLDASGYSLSTVQAIRSITYDLSPRIRTGGGQIRFDSLSVLVLFVSEVIATCRVPLEMRLGGE